MIAVGSAVSDWSSLAAIDICDHGAARYRARSPVCVARNILEQRGWQLACYILRFTEHVSEMSCYGSPESGTDWQLRCTRAGELLNYEAWWIWASRPGEKTVCAEIQRHSLWGTIGQGATELCLPATVKVIP